MDKHPFNRVSDRNVLNVTSTITSDISAGPHNREISVAGHLLTINKDVRKQSGKVHQISPQKMKTKGKAEDNLSDILSVKAEQIRLRLAAELKLNDDDFQDHDALEESIQQDAKIDLNQDRMESETHSRIPLSKARMKRRQILGMQGKEPEKKYIEDKSGHVQQRVNSNKSTVNIRNYRPGYTWSRGGRMKELRLRCLARKYLFIWRRKTFGRVPLSDALNHYEMSLKRQAFGLWHEFWWEIVKEWRLAVRAECHYRYQLGYAMFKEWKKFVYLRRIKNEKNKMALTHHCHKQTIWSWNCWRLYIKGKQATRKLTHRAVEFRDIRITRNAWAVWKSSYLVAEERRESEALALQFWSYRLQAQHWLMWKAAMSERSRIKEQMNNVCMYYNSVLATRCLKAWRLYIANRRAKKSHIAFALHVYDTHLKVKCFNHWSSRWHLLCSVRQHHHRMEEITETFRLHWVMWRWKQYIDSCRQAKNHETMALDHYNHHLLHFCLASFRLNVVHSHIKDMRRKLSLQLEASQLQRRFFYHWVHLYDERQEEKMAASTALAREHYNSNLTLKCFHSLVEYSQWRKHRKVQYAQAEAHFYLRAVPRCLFHMKMLVELERRCRQNAIAAKCFLRANVQRKVFITWKSDARNIRDQRMLYRMAVLHHESVVTNSFFTLWRVRTAEVEEEQDKMREAHRHFLYSLCQRVCSAWSGVVLLRKKREMNYVRAIQHHKRKIEVKCIQTWKQWVKDEREMKLKKEMAVNHRRRCVLTMCIQEWKAMWVEGKRYQSSADGFLSRQHKKMLQLTFKEWKILTRELAIRKQKKVAATIHFNRCLMGKVVQEWRSWAAVQAYKQSQAKQLLQQAVSQLQQLRVASYFKRWQAEMDKANHSHRKQEKANCHYCHILQTKSLHSWKEHTRDCLRKRLLHGQSHKFNDVRLTAKHFFVWRTRWAEKMEENSKTEIALWQWSLMLERKVLMAWQAFKEHQEHKKSRLSDAALYRRQRLLQVACCNWLTTADSLSQVRASTAARYQTKAVMDSFRIVQKCALHWKSWARRCGNARDKDGKSDKALFLPVASKVRLPPNLIEFQNIPSERRATWTNVIKPQPALDSPVRLISTDSHHTRQRPLPTRPSFLLESLQRAGLSAYMFSDYPNKDGEESGSDSQSTLLAGDDDLYNLPLSPERPTTGRFSPHIHSPSHQSGRDAVSTQEPSDSSFSAEVLSGSLSSLGPSGQELKPLHLDAEHSSSHTTSSLSPQLFTPSTQRSQFSGNPLLYSSPVSDNGHSRPVTTRTEEGQGLLDSDSDGNVVSGNLRKGSHGLQRLQFWEQQQHEHLDVRNTGRDERRRDSDGNGQGVKEPVVLLKPEYFMQKLPPKTEKLERRSSEDLVKSKTKNTPRSFATWDTSIVGIGGVFSDFTREGKGMLRHTPRELASPRRAPPPGILHNKASDSEADVSPLNTARSRGTVTFASPKSPTPEEEIISIRDRLKLFRQQKRKLRSLQKKYQLLFDWIEEQSHQETPEEKMEEEDSRSATEELDLVRLEVAQLQTIVDGQQPICEKLVQRAEVLAKQLNLPF